jgi:hypothetical protein
MQQKSHLEVTGALRVAVASAVLGAGLVVRLGGQATVERHLGEVDRAVETAAELGHVNVKRELLVDEVESLVLGVRGVHQVHARTDVAASDEADRRGVTRSRDAVGAGVVSAVEGTVLGASRRIRAEGGVPLVAGVAVGGAAGRVQPTPVGVKDDRVLGADTAARGRALSEWINIRG